jgi:hypothetical protein
MTLRVGFLMFAAVVITALVVAGFTDFSRHSYREGALCLVLAAGLAFVFFRKRKIALAVVGLSFIFVSAGLTALFHPTYVGILLTLGSAGAAYLIAVWDKKKHPNHGANDWKTLFDNETKS